MSAPTQFRAGDSVVWNETLSYPPADGWVLKYRLLFAGATAVEIPSVASGDGYAVSIDASTSSAWVAGSATLVSWVERAAERITIGQMLVEILPDLGAIANYDGRTANQKALADAKAALSAYLASGRGHVAEYSIAGRTMKFRSMDEIAALVEHYERECAKDRAALALLDGGSPGRVMTRF
ncbi:MAG: hypothetical protein KDG55_05995 [Rhodocyclaceae bacterium]|nr:hypothetical protein [Rhodocyclaceae bacterium]